MKLPSFLKEYFWEVDFSKLDAEEYPKYVIARLLEHGDRRAIEWMRKNFTARQINDVLRHSRELSNKSAVFWALVQGVEREDVLCLSTAYRKKRKTVWPY